MKTLKRNPESLLYTKIYVTNFQSGEFSCPVNKNYLKEQNIKH